MKESRWWIFTYLIIITAAVILCIFNAITYNKIANEKMTLGDVTPEGARALMAFNIIILIFLFPLWIWYVYRIVVNDTEKRTYYNSMVYEKARGFGKRVGESYRSEVQSLRDSIPSPSRWRTRPEDSMRGMGTEIELATY